MFLCTCIRPSYKLGALVFLKCSSWILLFNNQFECCFSMYGINLKLNQLMLFMFYLEKRRIVACNMLAKLVDFSKIDFLSTIVE